MKLSTAILALAALAAEVFAIDPRVAQHRALRLRRQEGGEAVAGVAIIGTSSIAKPAPSASSASQPQAVAVAAALVTSSVAAAPTAIAAAAAEGGAATESASASGAESASESASASASDSGAAATTTSSKAKAAKETGGAKKASGGSAELDLTILQFANLAEQLESTLYSQAAAALEWRRAGFTEGQVLAIQESLTVIGCEESTHETVLASVIKAAGSKAVSTCKFDFSVRSRSDDRG